MKVFQKAIFIFFVLCYQGNNSNVQAGPPSYKPNPVPNVAKIVAAASQTSPGTSAPDSPSSLNTVGSFFSGVRTIPSMIAGWGQGVYSYFSTHPEGIKVNPKLADSTFVFKHPIATLSAIAGIIALFIARKAYRLQTIKSILDGNYFEKIEKNMDMNKYVLGIDEHARDANLFGSKGLIRYVRTWNLGYKDVFMPEWNAVEIEEPLEKLSQVCTNIKTNGGKRNKICESVKPYFEKKQDLFITVIKNDLKALDNYLYELSGETGEDVIVFFTRILNSIYYLMPKIYYMNVKGKNIPYIFFGRNALVNFKDQVLLEIKKRKAWLNTLLSIAEECGGGEYSVSVKKIRTEFQK